MNDDAELLRRYAEEGAEEAFAELVRRHLNLVYSSALRRTSGDGHRAEDVAQQVFMRLARDARQLSRHAVLGAWLHRATRNAAINLMLSEQRRKLREEEVQTMHDLTADSTPEADWERLRPVLDDAMDQLGETDRTAVILRFFEKRPFAEIGRVLRLTDDAARMRVDRALDKLRALLASRGVTSTSAALALALTNQAGVAAPASLAASVTGAALTGATAGGLAPSISFLTLMSTSKIATGVAGVVLALTLGTTGYEVYASREAAASLVAASRENDALLAKLRGLQRQAEAADQATAALQKSLDDAHAAKVAEQKRAAQTTMAARVAEEGAFMAHHPEVRRAALDQWRALVAGMYAPLFKTLRLSLPQIEQFKDLAAQGMSGLTTGPNGEPIRYDTGGNRAEAQRQLQALLGDEGYQKYREFQTAGVPVLQTTTELAGELYYTSTPLTLEQANQLQRILSDGRVAVDWSSQSQYDWDAIMPQARIVLSDTQLTAFGHLRAQDQLSQSTIRARIRQSRPDPPTNASATPGK